jgi:hypothetical protein
MHVIYAAAAAPILHYCWPPQLSAAYMSASALLAFWSGAICLGRGALWIIFVLSVSYVSQHCSIARSVHVVFTYIYLLLVADSSMVPAALLA